jgi:hypothetical protein
MLLWQVSGFQHTAGSERPQGGDRKAKAVIAAGVMPYVCLSIACGENRFAVRGLHTDSGMGGGKLERLMHAYLGMT